MAATSQLTVEERLDRQESRQDISDLVAQYNRGLDARDPEIFMSVWHEDATYDVTGPFDAYEGRERIRAGIQEIWDALPETHHWAANLLLEFEDADHVTGKCDVVGEFVDHDGKFVVVAVSYDDRFERRDSVWKFASRNVLIHYRRSVPYEMYD